MAASSELSHVQTVSLPSLLKEKPLWLLVVMGILFFYRPLFLGETFFFRDLFSIFLTQKQLFIETLRAGELPLWDQYLHGGRPYFANALNSTWYPTNLLFLILPFFRAFNSIIVLHFLGYLIFAYLLARIIGLQPVSSFIVAIVYGFCGYTLSLINLLNMFLAMTHLPMLILCWHLFLLRKQRRWFLMAVFIGGIQVCAGSPEINILSILFLLGWSICYPFYSISLIRRLLLWGFLGAFIIGIASVQIIPQAEMLAYSSRRYGLNYETLTMWSLLPKRLLEFLFPAFFGRVGTIQWEQNYWGSAIIPEHIPLLLSLYMGGVSTMLAIIGGIHKNHQKGLPRRVRFFLLGVISGAILLSFGRFFPFFRSMCQYVPFISLFRYPIKFLSAAILPWALLTGYTVDLHFGSKRQTMQSAQPLPSGNSVISPYIPSRGFLGFIWGIALALCLFTFVFSVSENFAQRIQIALFTRTDTIMYSGLRASFLHATGIWILMALLYQYRRMRKLSWQGWFLAIILLVDFLSAGNQINHYAPEDFFTKPPNAVNIVRQYRDEGRIFRTQHPAHQFSLRHLPDDIMWMYRWSFEVLDNSFAAFFRLPVIFHIDFDRLAPATIMQLKILIESLSWEQRLPLLSAGNVTIIITSEDLSFSSVERIGDIPNWSGIPFYIYRNDAAARPVEFVTKWKKVDNDPDALGSMLDPRYDSGDIVILQVPESTIELLLSPKPLTDDPVTISINRDAGLELLDGVSAPETCGQAQITDQDTTTTVLKYSVSTQCEGYLVFSETFYPGWHITVNGEPTQILRANYAFSAIYLPPGDHEIIRRYRPMSLIIGVLFSMVACAALIVVSSTGWILNMLFGNRYTDK